MNQQQQYAAQDLYRLLNKQGAGLFKNFHIHDNRGKYSKTPVWIVYLSNGTTFEIFFWDMEEDERLEDYQPVYVGFFWTPKPRYFWQRETTIKDVLQFIKSNI